MQGISIKDLPTLSTVDESAVMLVGVPTTNSSGTTIQKNYKLPITSIASNNSNSNILSQDVFPLTLNNVFCQGSYNKIAGTSSGLIAFSVPLPYIIREGDLNSSNINISNLKLRLRTADGDAYIPYTDPSTQSTEYFHIGKPDSNQTTRAVLPGVFSNIAVAFRSPNQLLFTLTSNYMRTSANSASDSNLITDNITCTVTCYCELSYGV